MRQKPLQNLLFDIVNPMSQWCQGKESLESSLGSKRFYKLKACELMNLRGIYAEPFFNLLFEHLLSSSRFMTKKKWTRITTHEFFHNVAV